MDGIPFLVSAAQPLGLIQVTDLSGRRHASVLHGAFIQHIDNLTNKAYKVIAVYADGEGGIDAIKDYIKKVAQYNPAGPEQHVPVIERTIRTIKERVRAILCGLPYTLPSSLLPDLLSYVVRALNMIPKQHSTDNLCAREKLTGRKIDAKRDLRIEFGQYVQAKEPNIITNSMSDRTEGCIALLPKNTSTGSVEFLKLATLHRVTRDQWEELPTPDTVITYMNNMAGKQKRKLSKDPIFRMGTKVIVPEAAVEPAEPDEHISEEPTRTVTFLLQDEEDIEEEVINNVEQHETDIEHQSDEHDTGGDVTQEVIHDTDTSDMGVSHMGADYMGAEHTDVEETAYELPDIYYETNEDGDVVMDDSEAVYYGPTDRPVLPTWKDSGTDKDNLQDNVQQPSSVQETTHRYNLRQQRSNWRQKVFMTAVEAVQKSDTKYVYHTSIKACIKTHGTKATMSAVKDELSQMIEKQVWKPVRKSDIKDKTKIIPSHMFMKVKVDAEGNFLKIKARGVAGGNMQDKRYIRKEDISSPTLMTRSVMLMTAIAAEEGRKVITGDVPGAYLHVDRQGELYMVISADVAAILVEIDPTYKSYLNDNGTIHVQLLKALYGCVESAKLWYEYLRAKLLEQGFTQNPVDPCVFNKTVDSVQITVGIYVDDVMGSSVSNALLGDLEERLDEWFKGIKWLRGNKHNYIGMTFTFNRDKKTVGVSMSNYVDELMSKYNVTGKSKYPCSEQLFELDEQSPHLDNKQKEEFHSAIASVLFLAKRARPDLLLTTSFLTTRIQQPTEDDYKKLYKMLRYINTTRHLHLTIDATMITEPWISIDASYGAHADGKGHTGAVEGIGIGCFNFKSSKQKTVSKSSTEAEILATSDALSLALNTREFLHHQGYKLKPTKVYQDNESSIHMMTHGKGNSDRSKHIKVRNFWIADQINLGEIVLVHMRTEDMVSDLLTKPITGKRFLKLRNILLNGVESA